MPEEINSLVTDAISDIFIYTSHDADENLIKENVSKEKIHMLGNLMIDSLVEQMPKAEATSLSFQLLDNNGVVEIEKDFNKKAYGVMTFHRPNNVDNKEDLEALVEIWGQVSELVPLLFPIHPRTYKNLQNFDLLERINKFPNLFLIEPLGYLQFIHLISKSMFVLTDSGGIQEETTFLNIPCLTVRPTTERPITIWEGSNKLINKGEILSEINLVLNNKGKQGNIPKFWDGKTAERIVKMIEKELRTKD
jgi:UDP-N-acetylglucosamine 2-epimerase (non-hydrolysing)